jgi:hypothetical protein
MKSAFYPGAGTDIVPPIVFRSIKHWTYMDSQPRSEFGNNFYKGFSRPRFIPTLITVMNQNGFELRTTEADVFTFYHPIHEQTIRYETNSVFPDALKRHHLECDTLVLCGYELTNPPRNFIDYYSHIITNSHTVIDETDEKILLSKDVSTMIYNNNWCYWEPANLTTRKIQRYVTIVDRSLTYDGGHRNDCIVDETITC